MENVLQDLECFRVIKIGERLLMAHTGGNNDI